MTRTASPVLTLDTFNAIWAVWLAFRGTDIEAHACVESRRITLREPSQSGFHRAYATIALTSEGLTFTFRSAAEGIEGLIRSTASEAAKPHFLAA